MVYCNDCADDRGWPETNYRVIGRCELCGDYDECNDKASSLLPAKKVAEPEDDAADDAE